MSGKLKPRLDCKNPFQGLKIASWDPLRFIKFAQYNIIVFAQKCSEVTLSRMWQVKKVLLL